jgi:hypothetical protein
VLLQVLAQGQFIQQWIVGERFRFPPFEAFVPVIATAIVGQLLALVTTLGTTVATDRLWQGREAGLGDVLGATVAAMPRYLGVVILLGLAAAGIFALFALALAASWAVIGVGAIVIGALVFLFVGVPVSLYLGARLSLVVPVTVLEQHGVLGSIQRAWDVSRGHALLLFALSIAVAICAGLPLWGASMLSNANPGQPIGALAQALGSMVVLPIPSIAVVLAWGDLVGDRHRDSEVMARGKGRAVGAAIVLSLGAILLVVGIAASAGASSKGMPLSPFGVP